MNFHDSRSAEEIIAYRGRKVAVLAGIVVCGLLVWGLAPEPQPQFTATTDIPADWLPGRPLRSVGTGPPGARVAYVIGSMDGPATTVGPDGRWTLEWTSGNDVAPVLFLLPIGVDSPRVTVELPKPDPELSAKLEPAGAGKEGWRALVSGPPGLEVEARRGDDILGRCRLDGQGRCEILIRSSQGWGMLIVSNRPRLRYTFPRQHVQAP
ncbi:MAG: hypothetical protein MH204_04075, partial [Fimbriimonadaceae bacterium]|nr:hypothetical protein [Fimbriimonadaceae bacterium]